MHETHPVGTAPRRTISPATLAFTMFGMVAGGPFGLEDVMSSVSYGYAILVILVTLVFWSAPTAFMQAELASSRPNSGGFYSWTRDALGPFAGFMQGWLAIGSSIFDMPIYPTLVRGYLARVWPQVETGSWPLIIGMAVVVIGIVWNLLGARGVGRLASAVSIAILVVFGFFTVMVFRHGPLTPEQIAQLSVPPPPSVLLDAALRAAFMYAMWNCMGWDNASSLANEVERPQQTYRGALLYAVIMVACAYAIPVAAMNATGLPHEQWRIGLWVDVALVYGGRPLALTITVLGILAPLTMFVILMMTYVRFVVAMARDGYLPKLIAEPTGKSKIPLRAILLCALLWSAALKLDFKRLASLDVLLYGGSLYLQFVTLFVWRFTRPDMLRPFQVPGGKLGAFLVSVPPLGFIIAAFFHNSAEEVGGVKALYIGLAVALSGAILYVAQQYVWPLARALWYRLRAMVRAVV